MSSHSRFFFPSNPLNRDPARGDWTLIEGEERKHGGRMSERLALEKLSEERTTQAVTLFVHSLESVCVSVCLAAPQLFPGCHPPSGGWINEVCLTWGEAACTGAAAAQEIERLLWWSQLRPPALRLLSVPGRREPGRPLGAWRGWWAQEMVAAKWEVVPC